MLLQTRKKLDCDVLVVGGGAAGVRAAIAASAAGARVIMVLKGVLGLDGSSFCSHNNRHVGYQAGVGTGGEEDTPEAHARDTIEAGLGMCNPQLVEVLTSEAPDRLVDLVSMGARLMRNEEGFLRVPSCFCEKRRSFVISRIRRITREFGRASVCGVNILEAMSITRLLVRDNACHGAVGFNAFGEFLEIRSASTVLATGGGAGMFLHTMAPRSQTGDGYVLGYEAGAELVNMEFIQIMLGLARPSDMLFFPLEVLGEDTRVFNSHGKDVLERYMPSNVERKELFAARKRHYPFSMSDASGWLDIAVMKEILAGRHGENGGIFIKVSSKGDASSQNRVFEVLPYAHAFNGGLLIDECGQTKVEGLFACGETAGGMHGANRLGGNMMCATQVFGERAGRYAAHRAKEMRCRCECANEVTEEWCRLRLLVGRDCSSLPEIERRVRRLAWENLMTVRSEDRLNQFLVDISMLENELRDVRAGTANRLRRLIAVWNMLKLSRIVAHAARERRESRGSHFREDFSC